MKGNQVKAHKVKSKVDGGAKTLGNTGRRMKRKRIMNEMTEYDARRSHEASGHGGAVIAFVSGYGDEADSTWVRHQ
jgi:hypothetical protein